MVDFNRQLKNHIEFQKRGTDWLNSELFQIIDITYHNTYNELGKAILKNKNNDITSLYLKGCADNYIIREDFIALIDWKTQETDRPNTSIEATSYAFHMQLAKIGVKIIYAYWDPFKNFEKGFMLNPERPFDVVGNVIFFSSRANNPNTVKLQKDLLVQVFTNIRFIDSPGGYSADPFFVVRENLIKSLPDWKTLIPTKGNRDIDSYRNSR